MATSTPNEVKRAIEDENDAYLTKFPGIGKKTARQIILDLKGKVNYTEASSNDSIHIDDVSNTSQKDNYIAEALLALEALGYSKREISKVEKTLQQQVVTSVDEAVKIGLQALIS